MSRYTRAFEAGYSKKKSLLKKVADRLNLPKGMYAGRPEGSKSLKGGGEVQVRSYVRRRPS